MDAWAETDLAWQLAEAAGGVLAKRDRDEVYTAIGAGNSYTAIAVLLQAIERCGAPISPALAAKVAEWLNGYTYNDDTACLRDALRSIQVPG